MEPPERSAERHYIYGICQAHGYVETVLIGLIHRAKSLKENMDPRANVDSGKEDDAEQMQPATATADLDLSNNAQVNEGSIATVTKNALFHNAVKKVMLSSTSAMLIKAARKCDYKSMKKILEEHKDLNLDCTDEIGQAAVHYAASKGHMDALTLLVENGAQLDLPDKTKGKTALHRAVSGDQVEAVEYLVYAGANMDIKDKDGKMPEECAISDKMRMTLSNMRDVTSTKTEALDIRLETNKVCEGSKTSFKNLGLVVEYSNNGKGDFFIMMCRRNTNENSKIDFGFLEKEEIVSDVFIYSISCNHSSLQSTVTIPLFGGPGEKEVVVIKTDNENEFIATDVKENTKNWTCKFNADLQKYKAFIAVCRPMKETFQVGSEATTIHSVVDKRVEISIPENTFDELTKVTMEITEPLETIERRTEEFKDIISATSFYTIIREGGKPAKSINFKVPLPSKYKGNGSVVILSMDKDEDEEDENSWSILDLNAKIIDDRVVFDVASFSVKVGIESLYLRKAENDLSLTRQVSQLYRKSRRREHSVIFLILMKRMGETNMWNMIVECCHEDKAEERQKHWENESYEKQEEKSHDKIIALSKQKYRVKLNDAVTVVGTNGDVNLEFHPKGNHFKQFVCDMNADQPCVSVKLEIIQLPFRPGTVEEDDKPDVEKLLTSFTFKLERIVPVKIPDVIFQSTSGVIQCRGRRAAGVMWKKQNINRTKMTLLVNICCIITDFLDDNCMKKLMLKLEDEGDWFPVIILMGISFSEVEKGLATLGNLSNMLISLALTWRDKSKEREHIGVPVIVSALAKGGAFALSRAFCGDLKNWYVKQKIHDDVFCKWLKKAYTDRNLLNPGDYQRPMSDSYLAIISTHLEPSLKMANALQLTNEEHMDVVLDKAYINNRLKAMKLLVVFRMKSPSMIKGLEILIRALEALDKSRLKHWALMCARSWVKRTADPMDPFRTQVDELMKTLN